MQCLSPADGMSRRDFLKWAGVGAAALALPAPAPAGWFGESSGPRVRPARLARTHDLPSLSAWGPYSKKYFGVSHIPEVRRGLSFDLSVFPLPTEGPVRLPSVTDPSGVHPWEAAPDLEFYSLRLEMIWKDQFYCDLSFSRLSDHSRLIRLELVNQTGTPREITLNCLAQLVFPPLEALTAQPIRLCRVELPRGAVWIHALDYADLQFATPRPTDNLAPDGQWRGEERRHESVGGSVVAQDFGREAGDTVVYRMRLKSSFSNASLVWRFQMDKGERVTFRMDGLARREVTFQGNGKFDAVAMPLGPLRAGDGELSLTSLGGAPVALNGFAVVETESAGQVRFAVAPWHPVPEIETVPAGEGLILKYADVPNAYGFVWGAPLAGHRALEWRALDAAFGSKPGPNTRERIFGNRRRGRACDPDSLFIHAASRPFTVAPKSTQVIYGLVCEGPVARVRRRLTGFQPQSASHERVYRAARQKRFQPVATPDGENYRFSQRLMAATTLTNLVYPLYTQRNYIRHYSPGRSWDCLYTWDAGFIGLGLLELDLQGAVEILNAYTTPPGAQSAFIHHGSPVPVQIYLFHELWNRTQSRELLEYFYPRLRQYHLFLAGRLGSSTTRRHRDHLICTWDYFYNSGGWDDYPPQKFVHAQKLEAAAAPAVNSSHTIRCAKLLRQAAAALGRTEDFAEYDEDIVELSASLQRYSWDAASGYFGYVMHDGRGEPTGILRDGHGVNFNMGLDGVYPLVAGICSREQERQIVKHLFSRKHIWMDIGITTVDQSAPYFSPTGYWNGSVWLAHQWFLWKTMLDLGRVELADRIARTGLDLWKRVTDASYDCMEHFMPREPFGAGWPQFTSLSSPVLPWFASLYTPGRLTCGFEVWLEECRFSRDNRRLRAKLRSTGARGRPFSVLARMSPGRRYQARWNGTPATFTTRHDGLLQIQLPRQSRPGELRITSV
ncbi:MAG: twin-arginine translocation signal domain-containing protein [Verrucomicrobiota bacterium]|nr:twin-arginine translocation signal domain-containing protein [Verrucomicrobiota bacterium]